MVEAFKYAKWHALSVFAFVFFSSAELRTNGMSSRQRRVRSTR